MLRLLTAVGVLVALLVACVSGRVPPSYTPPEKPSQALRIGSFNIRFHAVDATGWLWEERRAAVVAAIELEQPDIVGLQEVSSWDGMGLERSVQIPDLERLLPEYALAGARPLDDIDSMNPVLYRRDRFTVLDSGVLYFRSDPDQRPTGGWEYADARLGRWVLFRDGQTDREFLVANAHYHPLFGRGRRRASRILAERLPLIAGSRPIVVTGDLNAFPGWPAVRSLRRRLNLSDAIGTTPTGTYHAGNNTVRWGRVDHVLVGPQFTVTAGYVSYLIPEGRYPSDHFAVFADLQLTGGADTR